MERGGGEGIFVSRLLIEWRYSSPAKSLIS